MVTLEPVESAIDEAVDVRFAADTEPHHGPGTEIEFGYESADPPEPIVNGRIDLGVILTEFFSLGVDPYPRKPDAAWQPSEAEAGARAESPFAALAKLKDSGAS